MKSGNIHIQQLFHLMILFQLGSIGINLGNHIGKDMWISFLLGMMEGAILFIIYYSLHRQYPNYTYAQILQELLGRFLGTCLIFLYSGYFIYIGSRVVRDIAEILTFHTLYETPTWFISIVLLLATSYAGYKGIDTTARAAGILLKLFLFLWITFLIFIFLSGLFHLQYLQPILQHGWQPLIQNILPLTIPYGGMITFLMLFPYIRQKDQIFKRGLYGILISGTILTITMVLNIGILGEIVTLELDFPLLTSSGLIRVGTFIQRLEPVAIILLIIGVFFKVFIFHYTSSLSLAFALNKKNSICMLLVTSIIMACLSIFGAANNISHLYIGLEILPYYFHIPFQIIIPIGLLLLSLVHTDDSGTKKGSIANK
ncbi:endospore germination permease [Bacillus tropicus]|uniref:GerAB/ArcD/ProY family transporter n=1 Tax=Bacillus tropicus TaxID=2026188 RepID=UPI003D1E057A